MSLFVQFKPYIGCLLTHMAAWEFLGINKTGRDIFHCIYCDKNFYYPTRKDESPTY